MTGYSDRINHALAFAAKHHDQRVRRGLRAPYGTQSANLAVILTRYGCDEDTVTAGILLDVVKDYVREGFPPEVLQQRIGEKFGSRSLEIALMVSERKTDADGMELSAEEQRQDVLVKLRDASAEARFLAAAEALHTAGTVLADLRRTVDAQSVWGRVPGGGARALEGFRRLQARLTELGLRHAIADELDDTLTALAALAP